MKTKFYLWHSFFKNIQCTSCGRLVFVTVFIHDNRVCRVLLMLLEISRAFTFSTVVYRPFSTVFNTVCIDLEFDRRADELSGKMCFKWLVE